MRKHTNLISAKRTGFIRTFVSALILSIFGFLLVLWGWNGWTSGEIMVHPKGRQAYLAGAGGPNSDAFSFEVWSCLLVGGVLSLVGPAMLLYLLLGPREGIAKGLTDVGLRSPTAGSPWVPAWLVAVVLISLFSFFGYIAFRGASGR
jgi:hypothetical protein